MTRNPAKILSASRRTDIPAFYMDWFMENVQKGAFTTQNPFNRRKRIIDLKTENVRAIVFWSKNFAPFLQSNYGKTLIRMGYHLFFNFTINSHDPLLEMALPPLLQRIDQLKALSDMFGADHIVWRFDPVCFYQLEGEHRIKNNLTDFETIATAAAAAGITTCVTSFLDTYAKIKKRIQYLSSHEKKMKGFEFLFLSVEKKTAVIRKMANVLASRKIQMGLCCEKELWSFENLPGNLFANACIDGRLISRRTGLRFETRKDSGQRATSGCQCTRAIDIGNYERHPCRHNCLFCYANPIIDTWIKHNK